MTDLMVRIYDPENRVSFADIRILFMYILIQNVNMKKINQILKNK